MGNIEVSENDIDFNRQNEYKTFEQPDETEENNEINTDVERSEAEDAGSKKTPRRARAPKTKVERNLSKYKVRPPCTDKC